MIEILKLAEKELPYLLKNGVWQSLDVDYYPPRVERVWCEYGNYRLCIHIMHPTDKPCLFHKHRWKAAFKIIKGSYEMGLAYSEKEITSEEAYNLPFAKFILDTGSYYEMTNTHLAHYVRPLKGVSISLMLSGELYKEDRKEILGKQLLPLSDERKLVILNQVYRMYNGTYSGI